MQGYHAHPLADNFSLRRFPNAAETNFHNWKLYLATTPRIAQQAIFCRFFCTKFRLQPNHFLLAETTRNFERWQKTKIKYVEIIFTHVSLLAIFDGNLKTIQGKRLTGKKAPIRAKLLKKHNQNKVKKP